MSDNTKENLVDQSCVDFAAVLASRAPVPGGGGAAALTGALGIALCSMVANLTIGRKKYAMYEKDLAAIIEKAEKLRKQLLALVDADAEAFKPLSRAYSIPKYDPSRAATLESATLLACRAPLEMMRCCCDAICLLEEALDKGSVTLVSDVGCGAACCGCALESASLNIYINTRTLQDREEAARLDAQADTLRGEFLPRARALVEEVERRLRGAE